MNGLISIVIPVYNEDANMQPLYDRICHIFTDITNPYELILINDGSSDGTLEAIEALAAQYPNVKGIHFSRNFGHQAALSAGYHYASGDAVICMDGDLQHPPELIPELIRLWKEGYEVVYTIRSETDGVSLFKRLSSKLFYKIIRKLFKVNLQEGAADFRLIDRKVVDAFNGLTERGRFIRALIPWLGFKSTAVHFSAEKRMHGQSKYSVRRMLQFAVDGIISFSDIPLRMAIQVGVLLSIFTFLYLIYVIVTTLVFRETVSGWASLMSLMLFMFGVNLVALGIIGQYISRIYEESKNRPLYVVSKFSNFQPH